MKLIFRERYQYGWYVGIETGGSINGYCVELKTGVGKGYGGRHNTRIISIKRFLVLWVYQMFLRITNYNLWYSIAHGHNFVEVKNELKEARHLRLKTIIDKYLPN